MLDVASFISTYSPYIIPPVVGAFIGYLTNKIAIKMLFRPLKAYRFLGIRIPMTPGVIPSKRKLLAQNIGEMVGGHLLTSKEIGKALEQDRFQNQLGGLIKDRIGRVLNKNLPSLPRLIPRKYRRYFIIASKTVSFQLKTNLQKIIATEKFEKSVKGAVTTSLDEIMMRDVDLLIRRNDRQQLYSVIDRFIERLLCSNNMDHWMEDFLYGKLSDTLNNKRTLREIIPDSIIQLVLESVKEKTPDLLGKLVELLKEPEIQEKLIHGIKKAVDGFVETLGPMGGMVQGFLNIETISKVVKDYLEENEDDLAKWLEDEEVQEKVSASLISRLESYLDKPVVELIGEERSLNINRISSSLSKQIMLLIRKEKVITTLSTMIKENLETYLNGGNKQLGDILNDAVGEGGEQKTKDWIAKECVQLLRSERATHLTGQFIDQVLLTILRRPVGPLSNFIPEDVRVGVYGSIQKISSAMLAVEVPGLVDSLNIRQIIAEKIDSLDLLKLERLLLSIMEEQFKYINLFGALLGFLIGGLNVVFLLLL